MTALARGASGSAAQKRATLRIATCIARTICVGRQFQSTESNAPKARSRPLRRRDRRQEMEQDFIKRIESNPNYQRLVAKRTSFGWTLTALMMIVYYGYILLIAFDKELLGRRIGNSVITWGIPIGLFVILFTIVITGIYVRRANREFDELTSEIRKEGV
jgi:uncharacterized membrane protein (DUF485 family)